MDETGKQQAVERLLESGRSSGRISSADIDAVVLRYDFEMEELDALLGRIEEEKIPVVSEMSESVFMSLSSGGKENPAGGQEKNAPAEDSVRTYLREIGAIPLLTPEEEIGLAKRVADGDTEAEKRLEEANLRLKGDIKTQNAFTH